MYPAMPIFVAALSAIAGFLYVWSNVQVLLPTAVLYAAAAIWYGLWARKKVLPAAPEEVAARIAEELARRQGAKADAAMVSAASSGSVISRATGPILMPADPLYTRQLRRALERLAWPLLGAGILSLFWMILRARGVINGLISEAFEVTLVIALWTLLFLLVSAVGLLSTRDQKQL